MFTKLSDRAKELKKQTQAKASQLAHNSTVMRLAQGVTDTAIEKAGQVQGLINKTIATKETFKKITKDVFKGVPLNGIDNFASEGRLPRQMQVERRYDTANEATLVKMQKSLLAEKSEKENRSYIGGSSAYFAGQGATAVFGVKQAVEEFRKMLPEYSIPLFPDKLLYRGTRLPIGICEEMMALVHSGGIEEKCDMAYKVIHGLDGKEKICSTTTYDPVIYGFSTPSAGQDSVHIVLVSDENAPPRGVTSEKCILPQNVTSNEHEIVMDPTNEYELVKCVINPNYNEDFASNKYHALSDENKKKSENIEKCVKYHVEIKVRNTRKGEHDDMLLAIANADHTQRKKAQDNAMKTHGKTLEKRHESATTQVRKYQNDSGGNLQKAYEEAQKNLFNIAEPLQKNRTYHLRATEQDFYFPINKDMLLDQAKTAFGQVIKGEKMTGIDISQMDKGKEKLDIELDYLADLDLLLSKIKEQTKRSEQILALHHAMDHVEAVLCAYLMTQDAMRAEAGSAEAGTSQQTPEQKEWDDRIHKMYDLAESLMTSKMLAEAIAQAEAAAEAARIAEAERIRQEAEYAKIEAEKMIPKDHIGFVTKSGTVPQNSSVTDKKEIDALVRVSFANKQYPRPTQENLYPNVTYGGVFYLTEANFSEQDKAFIAELKTALEDMEKNAKPELENFKKTHRPKGMFAKMKAGYDTYKIHKDAESHYIANLERLQAHYQHLMKGKTPITLTPGGLKYMLDAVKKNRQNLSYNVPECVHTISGLEKVKNDANTRRQAFAELTKLEDLVEQYPHETHLTSAVALQYKTAVETADANQKHLTLTGTTQATDRFEVFSLVENPQTKRLPTANSLLEAQKWHNTATASRNQAKAELIKIGNSTINAGVYNAYLQAYQNAEKGQKIISIINQACPNATDFLRNPQTSFLPTLGALQGQLVAEEKQRQEAIRQEQLRRQQAIAQQQLAQQQQQQAIAQQQQLHYQQQLQAQTNALIAQGNQMLGGGGVAHLPAGTTFDPTLQMNMGGMPFDPTMGGMNNMNMGGYM